jgi:hypothetical protein
MGAADPARTELAYLRASRHAGRANIETHKIGDLSALRPAGPFTLRDRRRSRLARVSADHCCGVLLAAG